jgi:hypothetical protein
MRANEISGKPGVFFKVWVELGAALELAKEFKQRSRAQGMNAPCKKGQAFGRKPRVLRWHGVSRIGHGGPRLRVSPPIAWKPRLKGAIVGMSWFRAIAAVGAQTRFGGRFVMRR